jgi:hypothetical protein
MNTCRILSANNRQDIERKINELLKEGYVLNNIETIMTPTYTFVATVTKTESEK